MIILFGAILGAAFGALVAHRRKGRLADITQYAFIYAMLFAIISLFLSIAIYRGF